MTCRSHCSIVQTVMTKTDAKLKSTQTAAAARAARLAEELRANLRKRKDKARNSGGPQKKDKDVESPGKRAD